MSRNRYSISIHGERERFESVKDAKGYMEAHKNEIFNANNQLVTIYRGFERYGAYMLINGKIIEVEKGSFR